MARTLAEYLQKRRPDAYGSMEPDAINNDFASALQDPTQRPDALRKMRKVVPEWDSLPDDELVGTFSRPQTLAPPKPLFSQPTPPQTLQTIQRANQLKMGKAQYLTARKNIGATEALAAEEGKPVPEHAREAAEKFRTEVPHPGSVPPPDQTLPERLTTINDAREVEKLLKQNPGWSVVRPGGVFATQVVVLDDEGREQAVLDADANFNYAKTPTRDLMPHLTGQGSWLKQGLVSGMRGLMDSNRQAALDSGQTEEQANQLGDPSRTSSLGQAPMGPQSGYGWREFAGDAGEQAARQDPDGALKLARAMTYPTEAATRAMAGLDRSEKTIFGWLANANEAARGGLRAAGVDVAPEAETLRALEKANAAEAEKYEKLSALTADTREDLKRLEEAKDPLTQGRKQESAELAGRYRGQVLGQVADAVTPTEGTVVGGKLWSAAPDAAKTMWSVVPAAARKEVGDAAKIVVQETGLDVAANAVKRGVKNAAMSPLGKVFDDQPAASVTRSALREGEKRSPKDVVMGAKSIADMTSTMEQNEMARAAWAATDDVLTKHGLKRGSKAADDVIREATDAWPTIEGRTSASPAAQDLIDAWQPLSNKVFDEGKARGVYGEGLQRNPLHKLYGQDPTKAATQLESLDARLAADAGASAWQGRAVDAADAANVPGLRKMSGADLAQSRIVDQRTVQEVGELIKQRVIENGGTRQQAIDAAARSQTIPFPQAVGEAWADVLVAGKVPAQRAGSYLKKATDAFRVTDPDSFSHIDELLKNPAFQSYSRMRTVSGGVRPEKAQAAALEGYLKERDLVVIFADGAKHTGDLGKSLSTPRGNTVVLGKEFSAMNGQVVPREFAQAARESVLPPSQRYSAFMRKVANDLDKLLGLTQIKNTMTRGALGFEWRNNMDDMAKHIMSEGDDPLMKSVFSRDIPGADAELRKLVTQVTNAPLTKTGRMVKVGDQMIDEGELHRMLVEFGKVGKSWSTETAKEVAQNPGAGKLLDAVGVGDVNLGRLATAANKATIAPGEASAKLANESFRRIFHADGMAPNAGYSANDIIRAMNMLARMRRGVAPEKAGRDMLRLFIDFTDKSALDQFGGIFIPFWKFYTSSLRGALEIAAKNPAALRRLNSAMRAMERVDNSIEGGAVSPRFKPMADHAGQAPTVQYGGQLGTLRIENPWTTVTTLTGALSGDEEQGVGRYTTPLINKGYAAATGRDLVTGRSVLGLSEDRMKPGGTLWQQYKRAQEESPQLLSKTPNAQEAYLWAQYAPVLSGRLLSPDADKLARITMGLGGSPASRAPEDDVGAAQRAILSAIGPRISPFSPTREFSEKAKKFGGKTSPNRKQMEATEQRRGKAAVSE